MINFKAKLVDLKKTKRSLNCSNVYKNILKHHIPDKPLIDIPFLKSTNKSLRKLNKFINFLLFSNSRIIVSQSKARKRNIIRKYFLISLSVFSISYLLLSNNKISLYIRSSLSSPVKHYLNDIFTSSEAENAGLILVKNLFNHEKTKDAAILLLADVLKDPKFLFEGTEFGKNLLIEILKQPQIKEEIILTFNKVLLSELTKINLIQTFRNLTGEKELEAILAQFLKVVFIKEDIYVALCKLFMDSLFSVVNKESVKKEFSLFLSNIWADNNLRWNIIKKTIDFSTLSPHNVILRRKKADEPKEK